MTTQPKVKCGTCRHFAPFYPELRDIHENREGDKDGTHEAVVFNAVVPPDPTDSQ